MFLCDSQPRLLPQPIQHRADIPADAYAARGDVIGRVRLAEVYAGVDRLGILRRHVPERVFYNDRRVVTHAQFHEEDTLSAACAQEILIPLRRAMPALVLDKAVVTAQIQRQRPAAVRAGRDKLRRNPHILLPLEHLSDHGLVIKGLS